MSEVDLKTIDLNLLVALDVLLEECHVTNSAVRLNLSQPAMSRTLTRLRETFDDPLLVRVPNGYEKTPRAQALMEPIKLSLHQVRQTFAKPTFDPGTTTETFRVSTLDYAEVVIMPTLVKLVTSQAPNAQIENVRRDVYSIDGILKGDADVSIGMLPVAAPKQCGTQPLFEDRYVCVMHKDHPLAESGVTLDGYLRYPHLVVQTGKRVDSLVDDALQRLGRTRRISMRSPYYTATLLSIGESNLLRTAPERMASPLLKAMNLVMRELPFHMGPLKFFQIWHTRNNENPSHKWFREQISLAAKTISAID